MDIESSGVLYRELMECVRIQLPKFGICPSLQFLQLVARRAVIGEYPAAQLAICSAGVYMRISSSLGKKKDDLEQGLLAHSKVGANSDCHSCDAPLIPLPQVKPQAHPQVLPHVHNPSVTPHRFLYGTDFSSSLVAPAELTPPFRIVHVQTH